MPRPPRDPRVPLDVEAFGRDPRPGAARKVTDALGIPPSRALGVPLGPSQLVVRHPDEFAPYPGARFFNPFGSQAGLTAAGGEVQLAAIQLEANMVGIVRSLTLNVNTMLTTSNIQFTLRLNQNPVLGFDRYAPFPRVAASVSVAWGPDEMAVRAEPGALISLTVRVIDGGTYQVGGSFGGWQYSTTIREQFAGGSV